MDTAVIAADPRAAVQCRTHGDILEEQPLKNHDKMPQGVKLAQIL